MNGNNHYWRHISLKWGAANSGSNKYTHGQSYCSGMARNCWCGALIPEHLHAGQPRKYCKPEHRKSYYRRSDRERPPKREQPATRKLAARCVVCGKNFPTPRKTRVCSACCRAYAQMRSRHYNNLVAIQGDLCAICDQPETRTAPLGGARKLSVDHCHKTGTIRALLCGACNTTLGQAGDDPEILRAAARYITEHQAQHAAAAPRHPRNYASKHTHKRRGRTPRETQVLQWRDEGLTFKEISQRLGISKQRAVQLRDQAIAAEPQTCWCGTEIEPSTRPGLPRQYCTPEHRPHRSRLLTQGEYNQMVTDQGNRCAICNMQGNQGNTPTLCLDHCHKTGRVRQLLCFKCNTMLGAVDDNTETLKKAALYLEKKFAINEEPAA